MERYIIIYQAGGTHRSKQTEMKQFITAHCVWSWCRCQTQGWRDWRTDCGETPVLHKASWVCATGNQWRVVKRDWNDDHIYILEKSHSRLCEECPWWVDIRDRVTSWETVDHATSLWERWLVSQSRDQGVDSFKRGENERKVLKKSVNTILSPSTLP